MPDVRVTRDVYPEECPWLTAPITKGALLWYCQKYDYGCVTPNGVAVTTQEDRGYPFFEMPRDSLEDIYGRALP
jgi:hypothetical protein